MNKLTCINRDKSVITQLDNLEHLYTFPSFPVFFGCTNEPEEKDMHADMIWKIDPITGVVQLSELVPLDILYMEQHVDATGPTWDRFNNTFADYVVKNRKGNILEIGGGSGKLAKIVLSKENNITYTVIEPNPLFEETDNLKVLKGFFSKEFKNQFDENNTVMFSQVFEHAYEPEEFLNEISEFLPIGGTLVFAYPNLEHWFKSKFTNTINFEHTMLLTDYYVDYFLAKTGFEIIEKIDYEKHSHFYTVRKVQDKLNTKNPILYSRYHHYKQLFKEYIEYYQNLVQQINKQIQNTDSDIFLFGGHIFSQYLIGFGLDTSRITCILDNSPLKQGKRLYGSNLKVESPKILSNYNKSLVILKAGLYNEEIINDIHSNINPNTLFV
jgi:SAM-dependent methyltransferase